MCRQVVRTAAKGFTVQECDATVDAIKNNSRVHY